MAASSKASRIGIRQLKAELSRQLRRVEAGETLAVTDRDRVIATINPVPKRDEPPSIQGARELVAAGRASWSGRKLTAPKQVARLQGQATVSDAVIEDRR